MRRSKFQPDDSVAPFRGLRKWLIPVTWGSRPRLWICRRSAAYVIETRMSRTLNRCDEICVNQRDLRANTGGRVEIRNPKSEITCNDRPVTLRLTLVNESK